MNKSELIGAVAEKSGQSKAATGTVIDAVIEVIAKEVATGGSVGIVGFGTFSSSKRAARTGRNPQTGKEIKIAASVVPKFKAGAGFRGIVAKKGGKKK